MPHHGEAQVGKSCTMGYWRDSFSCQQNIYTSNFSWQMPHSGNCQVPHACLRGNAEGGGDGWACNWLITHNLVMLILSIVMLIYVTWFLKILSRTLSTIKSWLWNQLCQGTKSQSTALKMSSVEKMKISGIRSYSHTDASVIEFQKPLTLIVGHNGAGKTVSSLDFTRNCKKKS